MFHIKWHVRKKYDTTVVYLKFYLMFNFENTPIVKKQLKITVIKKIGSNNAALLNTKNTVENKNIGIYNKLE